MAVFDDWNQVVSGSLARESAFAELYRAHLSAVAAYASRRIAPVDAVDVVAETFTVAWRRFSDVPTGDAARPWLYGVARRVLANQRRCDLRRDALHDRLAIDWVPHTFQPEPPDLAPLRRALDYLSHDDRDILLLAGAEELGTAEIAVVLDVSLEVARNRLSRARRRLREQLRGLEIQTSTPGHIPKQRPDQGKRP